MSVTEDLGRDAVAYVPEPVAGLWRRIDRGDLGRVCAVGSLAAVSAVSSGVGGPSWLTIVASVAGLVLGCWPIVRAALDDIRARRMSMELSMLLAIVAAALIGEWVTALVITAFVLAAEILEDLTMDRGRDALTELMSFLPSVVQVREGSRLRSTQLADVRVGDVVVVFPGGRVPVDGVVVDGASSVDQSRITGEPLPVDVAAGDSVFSGSVNQTGAIAVRAEQVGESSSYGRIVAAVRSAQQSRAPIQRLADRVAGWLVYLALGGAAVTYLVTRDLTATISVVIVAGACGVAAGTPLAVLAAIARSARSGAFVKDGAHLEALSTVDTVVFDKTGTLTHGEPEVTAAVAAEGFDADELLALAAGAETYSEHPVGQAIVRQAAASGLVALAPEGFVYEPGQGVTAEVGGRRVAAGNARLVPGAPPRLQAGSAVHVAIDGVYAGSVVLSDRVRDSAAGCVKALRRMGIQVVMFTGDGRDTARAVSAELGIGDVRAELLPTAKSELVRRLRAEGRRVAMVGDGINDAPALAEADVGIAMGSGTHVARESADMVLISSDLADLTEAVRTARRARRIILANVAGTIAVDVLGMLLAAVGVLGPLLAAVVHVGSESAFILNSARLIPPRSPARRP